MDFISSWINVLTHPSVATFDAEKANASSQKTLYGIIVSAVVSAILAALLTALFPTTTVSFMGVTASVTAGPIDIVRAFINTLANILIVFYVFAYVFQFVAQKWFGGTGTFEVQTFLFSTSFAPLYIVMTLFGKLFGGLGGIISFLAAIYLLVLTIMAIQSEQKFDTGKAIISWLISIVIAGIVMIIVSAITFGWL
jgi:hypothetical protein